MRDGRKGQARSPGRSSRRVRISVEPAPIPSSRGLTSPIGSPMSGTFTAIGGSTNKIVWQNKTPYRVGQGAGDRPRPAASSSAAIRTAISWRSTPKRARSYGGSRPALALTRRRRSTSSTAKSNVAIATGGNQGRSAPTVMRCGAFSLKGQLGPVCGLQRRRPLPDRRDPSRRRGHRQDRRQSYDAGGCGAGAELQFEKHGPSWLA